MRNIISHPGVTLGSNEVERVTSPWKYDKRRSVSCDRLLPTNARIQRKRSTSDLENFGKSRFKPSTDCFSAVLKRNTFANSSSHRIAISKYRCPAATLSFKPPCRVGKNDGDYKGASQNARLQHLADGELRERGIWTRGKNSPRKRRQHSLR